MSLVHVLERPSDGISLLCVGLILLLRNSLKLLFLCCFLIYEDAYTCLSVVGLRVVTVTAGGHFGEW